MRIDFGGIFMFNLQRTLIIILTLILVFTLTACGQDKPVDTTITITNAPEPTVLVQETTEPVQTITPTPTEEPTPDITPIPTVSPTNTPVAESTIYRPENPDIMGLSLDMRYEDAEIIAGNYTSFTTSDDRDAISAYTHTYNYFFGKISYVQGENIEMDKSWIYYINVDQPGYPGPMDIQVGDTFRDTIDKLGIPDSYFIDEYSNIYIDGEEVGSVYISDAMLESCEIYLNFLNNYFRTFFVTIEEGVVINYGIAEQLN